MERENPAETAHLCRLCGSATPPEAGICSECERTYGPRVARLLARAERDRDFAAACLANFPAPLRERFASLLGQRCFLPGADTRLGPGLRAAKPRLLVDAKWSKTAN